MHPQSSPGRSCSRVWLKFEEFAFCRCPAIQYCRKPVYKNFAFHTLLQAVQHCFDHPSNIPQAVQHCCSLMTFPGQVLPTWSQDATTMLSHGSCPRLLESPFVSEALFGSLWVSLGPPSADVISKGPRSHMGSVSCFPRFSGPL